MYTLENSRCDIIGFNTDGIVGFYRHSATQIQFNTYEEGVGFINYLQSIGKYVEDIRVVKW